MNPYKETKKGGFTGFFKGMYKGTTGLYFFYNIYNFFI